MKCIALFCCLILQLAARAQELIANGSFEDKNICTEYNKDCAPEAWFSTRTTLYYYQSLTNPCDGLYFCGVAISSSRPAHQGLHTFLYSRLLCRLRKGNQYRITFDAWSKFPVFDSLGVYFSTGDFVYEKRSYQRIVPALLVHAEADTDTLSCERCWRPFSFDYTATGEEDCIVLGSFKRTVFTLPGPGEDAGDFLLYFDKVSMRPLDPHELLCASADSMKTALYNVNERHGVIERRRSLYRNALPPPMIRARPTIEQRIDTLLIPDILFASGSAKLIPGSQAVLDSFCKALAVLASDSLVINGHTDSVGTLQYNYKLSASRANAVEQYIRLQNGGGLPKIYVRYHAFLRPIATNATPEGRTRNRRVELFLYRHEE